MACFTNLATLAQMRGDKALAIDYLAKAIALDSNGTQTLLHEELRSNILGLVKKGVSPFRMESLLNVATQLQKV